MVPTRVAHAAILAVALLLAGPLLAGCAQDVRAGAALGGEDAGAVRSLEAPEFARAMARSGTTLIDVRTATEFRHGHVAGARNINVGAEDFEERIEALDPQGTYALYCRDGQRSTRAVHVLEEHGLTRAYQLEGGLEAWMAYGGGITRQ